MREHRCHREDELLDALGRQFIGPDLRAHLDECDSCSELELVAGALLDDRAAAIAEAPVPPASAMWVRMQVRMKLEAEQRARLTLVIGQAASVLIALVLIAMSFGDDLLTTIPSMLAAAGTIGVIGGATALTVILGWTAHLVFSR